MEYKNYKDKLEYSSKEGTDNCRSLSSILEDNYTGFVEGNYKSNELNSKLVDNCMNFDKDIGNYR